jgi:hypothetical protein
MLASSMEWKDCPLNTSIKGARFVAEAATTLAPSPVDYPKPCLWYQQNETPECWDLDKEGRRACIARLKAVFVIMDGPASWLHGT